MMTRLQRLEIDLLKLEREHAIWLIKFDQRFADYRKRVVAKFGEEVVQKWEEKLCAI